MADTKRALMAPPRRRRDFFVYGLSFLDGYAPGVPVQRILQIEAGSAFELQRLSFMADSDGDPITASEVPIPLLVATFTDINTSRQLSSTPIEMANIFGNGQVPFVLPCVMLFQPSSVWAVTLTLPVGAFPGYLIRMALIGAKVFNYD